jgi:effector-binding domain-containing protein
MKKLFIRGVLVIVAIGIALVVVGFLLPSKAHTERSIAIAAPPVTVFALVNSFRQFDKWSPWASKDPAMTIERSGPEYGVGAHYRWAGNSAVGTGSQEIIGSTPNSEVKIDLRFGDSDLPSIASFTLIPEGDMVKVTWALDLDLGNNPANRYFGLFVDKFVGPDYEVGLAKLKVLAESQPKTDFSDLKAEVIENKPLPYAYFSGTTTTKAADIGSALAAAYAKVGTAMRSIDLKQAGAPLAVTRRFDEETQVYEFDAAVPVDRSDVALPAGSAVKYGETPAGLVLTVTHTGPYSQLREVYDQVAAFETAYGFSANGNSWEQYVSDPGTTPEADLITTLHFPVK